MYITEQKLDKIIIETYKLANILNEWHLPEYDEKDAKKYAKRLEHIGDELNIAKHSI